jgi:hypothetical protein
MPFEEGLGFDNYERASPVKKLPKTNHREPESGCRSLRSDLAFLEQRELLSEEQGLGHEGDPGANEQTEEGQQLCILQIAAGSIFFWAEDRSRAIGKY